MFELKHIIQKLSESQWDVLEGPSKNWLRATEELLIAISKADSICGNCGCEFDGLYKIALRILNDTPKVDTV
ncbi:MAG: hypothetical protein CVV57_10535 [Tenericutes bacterium HGW-Tenericutes-2]|nr:MAG: hypothetical protein CVV57_10535 [Tenericutes bacterium HGW-Tenericutes-2]PKL00470.1 MAG: hypothetical protein CVV56_06145 [Tenericutes bacterium HGW-Tenericutes-1]